MRHIICSDMHGNVSRLEAILEHSKFTQDDKLIHAGDCCDIGPGTHDVMKILEQNNATILVGNHELAHLMKHKIHPYDSMLDHGDFNYLWNTWVKEKKAQFVIEVDGVVISHAGISESLYCGYIVYGDNWVKLLNDDMHHAYIHSQRFNSLFYDDVKSPLWFRPYNELYPEPAPIKQICGHTPRAYYNKEILDSDQLFLIDGYDKNGSVTYAVIEDGGVSVVTFQPEKPIELYKMR